MVSAAIHGIKRDSRLNTGHFREKRKKSHFPSEFDRFHCLNYSRMILLSDLHITGEFELYKKSFHEVEVDEIFKISCTHQLSADFSILTF